MICAILLAAGRSQRMGTQKLLLPFAGQTVIAHIADQLLRSAIDQTFVVVGKDGARIAEALAGRPFTLVSNPDPDAGMLSSIRCGLRALPATCDATLVALGDQPTITSALIGQLLHAYRTANRGILVPLHAGKRGHPLLFCSRYRDEILNQHDSVGLRGLLAAHAEDVYEMSTSTSAVLEDMDFPDDYVRAIRQRSAGG